MEKRFFAIFSLGVKISKNGNRLVFERGNNKISILIQNVRGILVFGKVSISSDAINLILREDVPVFFLTKFGKLKGFLIGEILTSNNKNRLKQYELYTTKRVEVAKFLVLKKLEEIERIFLLNLDKEKKLLEKATDLNTIRGIEGNASKKMFGEFKKKLKNEDLEFKGRNYRPPTDEVNALLSFSYTMVHLSTLPITIALGYDPYISFLHTKRGLHASFCSDLMEPIRPLITYELIPLINRKVFKKIDFERDSTKGVFLKETAIEKFLNWFEGNINKVLEKLSSVLTDFSMLH
jgi:CRISPR-associated protein Cas1